MMEIDGRRGSAATIALGCSSMCLSINLLAIQWAVSTPQATSLTSHFMRIDVRHHKDHVLMIISFSFRDLDDNTNLVLACVKYVLHKLQ